MRPAVILALVVMSIMVCSAGDMEKGNSTPRRDINVVLRDHDKELLALPNVAGVYVGVIERTNEPCLKVMLKRAPIAADPPIPKGIEGYPVVTEITGEMRPLEQR